MKRTIFALLLFITIQGIIRSQNFSPYFTMEQHDLYLEYLIYNGSLKIKHPLSQPFSTDDILENLPKENNNNFNKHWLGLLNNDLLKFSSSNDTSVSHGKLYAGATLGDRITGVENEWNNYLFGNLFAGYNYKNAGLFYKHNVDQKYADDSVYFGSTGKITDKVIGRASEAYIQWNLKNLRFFMGRMNRNFGIINEPGLLLSDNPYSYDHIGLGFSNDLLNYTFLFTRLNDIYGFDIRDSLQNYSWNRRYLSVHRFELSILKNLEFAFTEGILFGGKDQSVRFQYINPVNIFFFSKMSDRKSYEEQNANAYMSFEIFYKPVRKVTLFGQLFIDDIDLKKELRDQFPDRLGWSAKAIYSDPFPGSQLSLKYNRISNWTYNSFYTWGNYTFYGKSLGYPMNGAENLTFSINYFRLTPFIFSLDLKASRQRKQDLDAAFIAEKTKFPIGTASKSFSSLLHITFFPKTYLIADLSFEYITYQNYENIEMNNKSFFNLLFTLKAFGIIDILNR